MSTAEQNAALLALQDAERRIAQQRTIAATDRAHEGWAADTLPLGLTAHQKALIAQGFLAGYAAAMSNVDRALMETKQEL